MLLRDPVQAFVGLGANLGDPSAALRNALEQLAYLPATRSPTAHREAETAKAHRG